MKICCLTWNLFLVYWVSGTILDLDSDLLTSKQWTQCYSGTYADDLTSSVVSTILAQCNKGKLLLACKPVANSVYTLAAMGLRDDVLYDCGTSSTCTNVANGVGWYFNDDWSWGFVSGGDEVDRNSCDTETANETARLCWHTGAGGGGGGYRCGSTIGLNSATTWERAIWHTDS